MVMPPREMLPPDRATCVDDLSHGESPSFHKGHAAFHGAPDDPDDPDDVAGRFREEEM